MVSRGSPQTLILVLKFFVTLHEKYLEYDKFPEILTCLRHMSFIMNIVESQFKEILHILGTFHAM